MHTHTHLQYNCQPPTFWDNLFSDYRNNPFQFDYNGDDIS